jgi:hypothetical protein
VSPRRGQRQAWTPTLNLGASFVMIISDLEAVVLVLREGV